MPKYSGVIKKRNKYYYYLYKNGKQIWSKGYDTAEEAAEERERAKKSLPKLND